MARVIMGYPGSGLSTWVKQQPDDAKPVWQVEFDRSALSLGVPVCIQYSRENLQAIADMELGVTIYYPAPECIAEYYDRMVLEGISESEAAILIESIATDLRELRESNNPNENHVILGRGEYCYDRH